MTASAPTSRARFFRRRRLAWLLPTFAAVVTLSSYALSRATAADESSSVPAGPPPPRVTVAPVEQQLVTEYEELTGRVDATETVELRPRVSGHIAIVHFQAGQAVRKGDTLFSIDSRWYRAQLDLAVAQAQQARAAAEMAEREARRADELLAASAISSEEAESRRSRAIQSQAALASAEAALASARLDYDHTEVRAPIDGRISRAWVTQGNLVSGAPGNATLLATIVSEGEAYVYADIDESTLLKFNRLLRDNRIASVQGRVPVEMQLADETGYPRRGYIESTDNRLNPATGSLTLRLVFANSDHALVPGMFARVRVPVSAPSPALLISERAIGTDQGQKFVLAVDEANTAVYRTVKLGSTVEGKRVIRTGLAPGDRVIVNGLQRVRPGMRIEPDVAVASVAPVNAPEKINTVAQR